MHQPGLFSTLLEDLLDAVFLAKILLANVLDLQAIGLGDRFCMRNHLFMQRLRKLGIIKNANAQTVKIAGHALGIAQRLQNCPSEHPVKAVRVPSMTAAYFSERSSVPILIHSASQTSPGDTVTETPHFSRWHRFIHAKI